MARTSWGATTRREKSYRRSSQHVAERRPPDMNARLRSRRKTRKACGSCWRCENVENQKAVSHIFTSALENSPPQKAKARRPGFPQLPQGPTTRGFFLFLSNLKQPTGQITCYKDRTSSLATKSKSYRVHLVADEREFQVTADALERWKSRLAGTNENDQSSQSTQG